MIVTIFQQKLYKNLYLFLIIVGVMIGLVVSKSGNPSMVLLALLAGGLAAVIIFYPPVGVVVSIFTIWLEHGLVNYTPALTLTKLVVLITGFSLVLSFVTKNHGWHKVKITVPLVLLLLMMLFSAFYSSAPQNAIHKLITFATQIGFIYLIVQAIRQTFWIKLIFGGLVGLSIFQAVQSFTVMQSINVHDEIVRLSGNYHDPNVFARGLLIALTICLLTLVLSKNFWIKIGAMGSSVLFMGAIFFTGSRSSVVISATIITVLMFLLLRTQGFSWSKLGKQLAFVLVLVVLNLSVGYYLVSYVPSAYTQRILNMMNTGLTRTIANDGRALLYYAAADSISSNPVLGVGLSGFRAYIGGVQGNYPHNIFLEVWAEMGIIGFVAISLLIIIPFIVGYRGLIKNRGDPENYYLLFIALAGYMVNVSYAQFIGQITSHKPLWIFMGLLLALDQIILSGEQGGPGDKKNMPDNYCAPGK